jgi:hypothetical protein
LSIGETVRKQALESGIRPAKPAMETLVSLGTVENGKEKIEVALVGQYFLPENSPHITL